MLTRPVAFTHTHCADFPRLRAAVSGAAADGARLVLLLRLSPLVPFSLLNYLLGECVRINQCTPASVHQSPPH
jgi:uncharacterized membrane protein YdjX (TVP38/TMEM64 family)